MWIHSHIVTIRHKLESQAPCSLAWQAVYQPFIFGQLLIVWAMEQLYVIVLSWLQCKCQGDEAVVMTGWYCSSGDPARPGDLQTPHCCCCSTGSVNQLSPQFPEFPSWPPSAPPGGAASTTSTQLRGKSEFAERETNKLSNYHIAVVWPT